MVCRSGYEHNVYYFDKNTLGDIIAIRNDYGNVVARYSYDAWGNHTVYNANGSVDNNQSSIGNINPFRYRGYYYDTETGFYYLQTRYYDPTICRFINADNYELVAELSQTVGQLNLYAYANNNPIMLTDETGEFAGWTLVLIGVIVGALAGGHIAGKTAVNNGKEGWELAGNIILGITVGAAAGAAAVAVGTAIASVLPGVRISLEFTK